MWRRLVALTATLVVLAVVDRDPARAQSSYDGKTLRIVVGLAAGGGFDMYARILARHLGQHISGNPTVIVENLTGAGSLIAANYLYKVAKPDGLTMGHFVGSLFLGQAMGQPGIEFDARRFEFVGAAVKLDNVCALTKASGITSLDQWMAAKTPVKLGGSGPGTPTDNVPRILRAALGLPIQVVTGYKGTSQIRLAAESGEVAGGCWSWESMKVTWRRALETGDAVVVIQATPNGFPDLFSVPLAASLAKTERARRLIEMGLQAPSAFSSPFVLPPDTPEDRVQMLRKAFRETLKDPAFITDANKAKLTIDPMSGEELERMVTALFALDPTLLAELKKILYD
jgi:tripartite-type tricarboxylate transporter receptor subunit TctC